MLATQIHEQPTTAPGAAERLVSCLALIEGPEGKVSRVLAFLKDHMGESDDACNVTAPLDPAGLELAYALIDDSGTGPAQPYARDAVLMARHELSESSRPRRRRRLLRQARRDVATGALATMAVERTHPLGRQSRLTVSGDAYLLRLLSEAAAGRGLKVETEESA